MTCWIIEVPASCEGTSTAGSASFCATADIKLSLLLCNTDLRKEKEDFWGSKQCSKYTCSSSITCWAVKGYFKLKMQSPAPAPFPAQALTAVETDWRAEKGLVGSKLNVRRLTASWAEYRNTAIRSRGNDFFLYLPLVRLSLERCFQFWPSTTNVKLGQVHQRAIRMVVFTCH